MIRRFRFFTECLLQQANKHGLAGELIIVEWNPPPGPRLHDVLELKTLSDIFTVRFIEVPPEIHRAIRNSDVMPLFQMIAKNVGIRRAKGEFIVATNPDLLFSDALISLLASRQLKHKVMYRIDRHDIPAEPPDNASMDELLAWCQANVLRVHRKWGSFPPVSQWTILRSRLSPQSLVKRLKKIAQSSIGMIDCRQKLNLLWRRISYEVIYLIRTLIEKLKGTVQFSVRKTHRFRQAVRHGSLRRDMWRFLNRIVNRLYLISLISLKRIARRCKNLLGRFRQRAWASRTAPRFLSKIVLLRRRVSYWTLHLTRALLNLIRQRLDQVPKIHTNGCGDFTLLSRQNWFALRGYPELPIWSMHIDSLLCYMAVASGAVEQVLGSPRRIYHMEHENSWVVLSPEERLRIFAKKPWIDMALLTDIWNNMRYTGQPIVYNDDKWGLADQPLDEVLLRGGEKRVIKRRLAAWAATGS